MTDDYEAHYHGYLIAIEQATPKIDPENTAVDVVFWILFLYAWTSDCGKN